MSKENRALDFATRNLIAETVRETVRSEIRSCALELNQVPVPQLHGPCAPGVELFVIGCVLLGNVSPADAGLSVGDFWAVRNQRVWRALLACPWPLDMSRVFNELIISGAFGSLDECALLATWAEMAAEHVVDHDLPAAVRLLKTYGASRKLARAIATLADGLCAGTETVSTVKRELRLFFTA